MSTIVLHSTLNISETDKAWFQRTTNRIWPMGYHGQVTDDVTWPQRCCDCEPVRQYSRLS